MDSIKILHLEDSHLDADLAATYLSRGGIDHTIERVELREDFLRALREDQYDLILADYALPDFDGISALEAASQVAPQTPFIFVSGTLGEDVAIQSLQHGATDYVLKTRLDRLVPAVRRARREQQERKERLRSQEMLRESERRFRQLADAMKQLVWTTDVNGRLLYANREFLEYLGFAGVHEADPFPVSQLHAEDRERAERVLAERLPGNTQFQLEYRLRRVTDGAFRCHLITLVPLRDEHGGKEGWVGTAIDIEQQKQREQALITSEKLAATGRLAASIAHEINNPLEALANLLYLISTKEELSPEGFAFMEMAEHELMRAAQITKQTLGFYRENSGRSNFGVGDLLDEVLAQYRSKLGRKQVIIEKAYISDARVTAMRGEIRQVFANLVLNAIDAVGHGGRIWLKIKRTVRGDASGYVVSVVDNGSGIAPENVERIFQPFFTTKKDVGTGLGLWVCQEIIQKHGGTIEVESRGNGRIHTTEFSVCLPEEQPTPLQVEPFGNVQRGSAA